MDLEFVDDTVAYGDIKTIIKIDYTNDFHEDYQEYDGREIESLKGIEYFTALTKLNCRSNKLTSLDVSKNIALNRNLVVGVINLYH